MSIVCEGSFSNLICLGACVIVLVINIKNIFLSLGFFFFLIPYVLLFIYLYNTWEGNIVHLEATNLFCVWNQFNFKHRGDELIFWKWLWSMMKKVEIKWYKILIGKTFVVHLNNHNLIFLSLNLHQYFYLHILKW
jgi:hypothetical protein